MFGNLKKIFYIIKEDKKKLPLIVLLFVGISLLDIIGIGLIGPYIAIVTNQNTPPDWIINFFQLTGFSTLENKIFLYLGILIVFVFFIKTISIIFVNYVIINFSRKLQIRLRTFLMKSYQNLAYEDFASKNSSEFLYNIQTLTSQFSQSVVLQLLRVSGDTIVAIVILIMLGSINLTILLTLSVAFLFLIIFYDLIFRKKLILYGSELNKKSISMVKGINEGIGGLKEIRILGKANYFYKIVKSNVQLNSFYQAKLQLISIIPRYLVELIMVVFVVSLTISFLSNEDNTTNVIVILGIYAAASLRLIPIATNINYSRIQFQFNKDSISRLFDDVFRFRNMDFSKSNQNSTKKISFNELKLRNICFSYKERKKVVINDISLTIKKGEIIAFVGESGSGKTTTVDLILGLLEPSSGKIHVNNQPINKILPYWRQNIGYLPQQIFLIDDTLEKNIALGYEDHEINNELLISALKRARLTKLVNSLEDGLKTNIGEKGVKLSGGQRQRIALARSFYHERDVLILDESTSALDTKIEKEIIQEVQKLKGDKTIIIITHRYKSVEGCDRVYKFYNGQIIKVGKPKDVLDE